MLILCFLGAKLWRKIPHSNIFHVFLVVLLRQPLEIATKLGCEAEICRNKRLTSRQATAISPTAKQMTWMIAIICSVHCFCQNIFFQHVPTRGERPVRTQNLCLRQSHLLLRANPSKPTEFLSLRYGLCCVLICRLLKSKHRILLVSRFFHSFSHKFVENASESRCIGFAFKEW